MSIANPKHPREPEGEWLQEDSSGFSSKHDKKKSEKRKDKSQSKDPFDLHIQEESEGENDDPWGPFEDLTRIDSAKEEVSGSFDGFEPLQIEDKVNSTEEHDLVF